MNKLVTISLLTLLSGCCRIERNDLPEGMAEFMPYNIGDTLFFRNEIGENDTIILYNIESKDVKRLTVENHTFTSCGQEKYRGTIWEFESSKNYHPINPQNRYFSIKAMKPDHAIGDEPIISISNFLDRDFLKSLDSEIYSQSKNTLNIKNIKISTPQQGITEMVLVRSEGIISYKRINNEYTFVKK